MNDTTTRIPEGSRVLYIGGGDEHNERIVGKFGVITRDDGSDYIPYRVAIDEESTRWWSPREALVHVPAVGDKVIPVNGASVGIPVEYLNAVGTVSEVAYMPAAENKVIIRAEFQSYQKPDDTIQWSFNFWKPADGHTLTVSDPFVPFVTGVVTLTGYLDHDGIHDMTPTRAVVSKVEGDIYTVLVDEREYVTGPGYVSPAESTEPGCGVDGCTECEQVPATPVEPAIITDLQQQIDTLTRELARANERVDELRTRAGKWERDFMRYAERIMQEANDRDWCSEYDRIMSEISSDLEIASIPEREEEVDIEWEETYTVTVTRSGTVTLRAGYGESDIEEAARSLNSNSDADRDEILRAVRDGSYESDSFVEDSAQES